LSYPLLLHHLHHHYRPIDSSFSSVPADPPHLHPFPTRRSSDLSRRSASLRPPSRSDGRTARSSRCEPRTSRGRKRSSPRRFRDRSEEHTSELQSPDHLVCRLLLEKKKIKYIMTTLVYKISDIRS